MAVLAMDWLTHFWILCNHCKGFNETWNKLLIIDFNTCISRFIYIFKNMCLFNRMVVAGSARAKVGLVNQFIAPVWWLLVIAQPLCNGIFLWHLWCCFVFRIMLCVPFGTLSYYQYWVRSPSSCLYRKQVLNVFCQVYASVGRSVNKYGRNAIWLAGTF